MRCLPTLFFLAALLPSLAWAQSTVPGATSSRAQAERNAVDLKQGMTPDEVRELLGKPRRTALRGSGGPGSGSGSLQWTYVWSGPASSSSSERSLNIDFAAKAADQWSVNGWGWSNY
jgi:hypothetical protein